jgi:hypothetical protein
MASKVTIFENLYSAKPFYCTVSQALDRIKNGKSRLKIEEIRRTIDKEKANTLKRLLPSVRFSGEFESQSDKSLLNHSGFMILDFDDVEYLDEKAAEICDKDFVYACWLSPRGNGLKALIRIADGNKHREHFEAIKEVFPEVDKSGINVSRVCFESYDPGLYINTKAVPFKKIKTVEKIEQTETVRDDYEVFKRLLKWLSNRSDAFVNGERNFFIFKLASACCRFGLSEAAALALILREYPASNDFKHKEFQETIRNGYKSSKAKYGTASFSRDVLVDNTTREEIEIDTSFYDESVKPKDVVYGADVKVSAMHIYKNGYPSVEPIGVPALDELYKFKRGEITCLTGIGNYGKSTFFKWYQLMRVIKFGEKFASFSPEDNPPEEYYFDFVEMLLGCNCTPGNPQRPNEEVFSNAFDFVSRHIFYVYPKDLSPTPDYIKSRFLELIIKEKVDGVAIDPFNQMTNDYGKTGGRSDKYLETVLSDFSRFAQANNVYMPIIAHPHKLKKQDDGNYPSPDVFDLADGAMWNNKMDNIIVYHRPFMQTQPDNPIVEFASRKIRRQKTVGKKGFTLFEYKRTTRRYEFEGIDYMDRLLRSKGLTFKKEQAAIFKDEPYKNDYLETLGDKNPF